MSPARHRPAAGHAGKLTAFGRFAGSRHPERTGTGAGGGPAAITGELHFGLGRGPAGPFEDAWIAPGRQQHGESQLPLAFHGPTIRFYDPRDRCLALRLDRAGQLPGTTLYRPGHR
jgi:hypothetical protein